MDVSSDTNSTAAEYHAILPVMLDWPIYFPFMILNHLSSFLNSTWVVVRLLAPFDFTPSSGTLFLTPATYLKQINRATPLQSLPAHNQWIRFIHNWKMSRSIFTSLLPRFTSSNTSSTEKPNRSSYCGESRQKSPEENNCTTGTTWVKWEQMFVWYRLQRMSHG